jgi:hypothetical protein
MPWARASMQSRLTSKPFELPSPAVTGTAPIGRPHLVQRIYQETCLVEHAGGRRHHLADPYLRLVWDLWLTHHLPVFRRLTYGAAAPCEILRGRCRRRTWR